MPRTRSCGRARSDACNGEVFNVGGSEPISHRDLVELLIDVAGTGRYKMVEWPAEKKAIDIGSFYADSSKFTAARRAGSRRSTCAKVCSAPSRTTATSAALSAT